LKNREGITHPKSQTFVQNHWSSNLSKVSRQHCLLIQN